MPGPLQRRCALSLCGPQGSPQTVEADEKPDAFHERRGQIELEIKRHQNKCGADRVEDARSVLNVGDKVEAKIVNIDRKSRSIGLSIKAKDMDDEKEAVQSLKDQDSAASPGTIGDLIKAQMDNQ